MRLCLIRLISILFLIHSSATFAEENILNWVGCGISKKSYMTRLAEAYKTSHNVTINLQGGGATRGIRDVGDLKADIGGSCRYHLPDNRSERKVGFEPVAWDALAVITHPDNPINNLSLLQVKAIYSGEIKNWKIVGGTDTPIKLYARKGKISGVGYSIRALIFSDLKKEFPNAIKLKSSGPIEKAIESNIDGIAITGISSARLRNVKILNLNGKYPDYSTIKSGSYALYRPLFITYHPNSKHIKQIKDFIRFAHSRYGRKIMRDNGVLPYTEALRLVMIQTRQTLESQQHSNSNLTHN